MSSQPTSPKAKHQATQTPSLNTIVEKAQWSSDPEYNPQVPTPIKASILKSVGIAETLANKMLLRIITKIPASGCVLCEVTGVSALDSRSLRNPSALQNKNSHFGGNAWEAIGDIIPITKQLLRKGMEWPQGTS